MNESSPVPLHDQLRDRINLNSDCIAAAARDGQIEEYEDQLASLLRGFESTYIESRLYEDPEHDA